MRWLISPTSSRKTVPPSAISRSPRRSRCASVKLPRIWPKSSDSSSDSGTPAQLTVINGRRLLGLCSWMNLATNSLPTPLSPVMSTFASLRATHSASANKSVIA